MNVGVDADRSAALGAISSAFCTASEKREEDPLSVMRRAHLNGKHRAQSGEKSSAGVGQHIYIGQFSDASGLSYLNARYYNGAQGQFTTEDPVFWGQQNLQDPQSFNAYSYSENNPIMKEDPSGKFWDLSGSVTIPNIIQPELPGPSFSS
jgi:RHS repeat-associated protein